MTAVNETPQTNYNPLVLSPLSLQTLQLDDLNIQIDTVLNLPDSAFRVSVANSITRILTTKLGERAMRPEFGSNLYLLRDRDFNAEWRILATRFIYEAITRWEPRVRFKQLHFNANAITGKHTFYLELEPSEFYD